MRLFSLIISVAVMKNSGLWIVSADQTVKSSWCYGSDGWSLSHMAVNDLKAYD